MSMKKREKTRELSEEVKIVARHGQSQGYKSISRDLDVPVSTVPNVVMKFKAHGTVANLSGRGHKRKLDRTLQRRIVRMVEKAPESTAKQIQADLQTQGSTVSTHTIRRQLQKRGFYHRRPRRTPLLSLSSAACGCWLHHWLGCSYAADTASPLPTGTHFADLGRMTG